MKETHLSWRQFEAGRDYNSRTGLYENVAQNERFYRGDQWHNISSGTLPTPVFNIVRRVVDYMASQISSDNIQIFYSDENMPFLSGDEERKKVSAAVALLNRNAAFRWEKCRMDRLIRQVLLDAAVTGDGVMFTYWDPSIVTGQVFTGDFVTVPLDSSNLFVADVNSADLQSQDYVIVSGRAPVESLRAEALAAGVTPETAAKILPDGDTKFGAGDLASVESTAPGFGKATYIIKFFRDSKGNVCFEKSVKECVIRTVVTGLRLYPVTMFSWLPTKNSYHGTSPVTSMIQNQKYINKAYALLMKHMIDSAFSKVVYDKTRVPEWTNEVGQAIGVIGGDLDGVAKTITPGEMDTGFTDVIKSVIDETKKAAGATESSLGEANPTNTSAIIALQESNDETLDTVRSALYTSLEELAAIWVDFMCAYYADGRMVLSDEGAEKLDCRLLRAELIRARVDVGTSTKFSKTASMNALKALLDGGHITLRQYLERLPDGIIPLRDQLIAESEPQNSVERGEPSVECELPAQKEVK